MKQIIKILINKIITKSTFLKLMNTFAKLKMIKAKKYFNRARKFPVWLSENELEELQKKYRFPPEYNYDPKTLEKRGKERAKENMS